MAQRKTFSKLLQLQRNLKLMELTNALLMSLAFHFCLMWWGKPQSAGKIYDFARASTALPYAIFVFKSGSTSE